MKENNIDILKKQLNPVKAAIFENGLFSDSTMIDTILLFIFLRRMECLFAPIRDKVLKAYNDMNEELPEDELDEELRKIAAPLKFYSTSDDTMEDLLKKGYLDSVAGFEHYFKTFDKKTLEQLENFGAYTILGQLTYSKIQVYVTNIFCSMDFGADVSDDEFQNLINELLRERVGRYSDQYASWEFSNIMYQLLVGGDTTATNPTIYDPVCGSCKLLRDIASKFKDSNSITRNFGQDINVYAVATANLIANGLKNFDQCLTNGDVFMIDKFANEKFDYVIADLPFNMSWNPEISFIGDRRFRTYPSKDDATLLFVQHIVSKMKDNGKAVFTCLPKVFTASDSGSDAIRTWLLEEDIIEAMVLLPSGIIERTNIPFCICVLNKNKKTDRKGKIQIIDCNKLWSTKKNGKVLIDEVALHHLNDTYLNKEGVIDKDSFFCYKLDVCQPMRYANGKIQLKDGEKVADKKKTLSVTIPASEQDIVWYVQKNYLNHADPESWVDATTIKKFCSIDLKKLTLEEEELTSFIEIQSDANKIKSQIEHLLDDIFTYESRNEKQSEPVQMHKETCMLNALVTISRSRKQKKDEKMFSEGEYPILYVDNLRNVDNNDNLLYPENPYSYTLVSEEDTLIIMSGGNAGEVIKGRKGCLSANLAKINVISDSILPSYLYYMLKAKETEFRSMAKGAERKCMSTRDIYSLSVNIPSISEQQRIVDTLSAKMASIDKLLPMLGGKAKKTIQDYRQALIIDAVRGEK